ncbi:MAG: hypothetical protein PHN31_06645, partial [Candidatus Gracilibacteria bacterium]|nr:hypothetical protein [Candidatus Gracilibacteria bacterium]
INLVISYINSNKGGIKLEQLALIGNTATTAGGESGGGEINEYVGCTGTGQILTGLTIYRSCNTSDIIICTGSGTGYTLAACNEGTNIAGTGINSYGKYYQWGNNYGFLSGTITTTTLANTTGYGPGNYYSGTYFVLGSSSYRYDWTTVQNDDLWGGVTDTNEARQGPCQSGYHIPRETEWGSIVIAGGWSSPNWTDDGIRMMNALKLPFAGYIEYTNGKVFGYAGLYSSSSFNGVNGYLLHINEDIIYPNTYDVRSRAFNIRCIKN